MPLSPSPAAIGLCALLATTASAQDWFDARSYRHLPPDDGLTRRATAADVDADGDLDLLLARIGPNRVLQNDGHGRFSDVTAAWLPALPEDTAVLVPFDADGDGDVDLFEGTLGFDRLHVQQNGAFVEVTLAQLPVQLFDTMDAAAVDVDGDNDLDLILAVRLGPASLYLNDGAGNFADATATHLPGSVFDSSQAVAVGDLDGDRDPDLLFARDDAPPRLWLNGGNGVFADASATSLPANGPTGYAIGFLDLEGDGDLDALIGTGTFDVAWINDGAARFTDASASWLPGGRQPTLGLVPFDVDGDNDQDVLRVGDGVVELLLSNGSTLRAAAVPGLSPLPGLTRSALVEDLDRDGDPDIVLARVRLRDRLLLGDGAGTFVDASASEPPSVARRVGSTVVGDATLAIAVGDLDGDGRPDLVAGNDGEDAVWSGDGRGRFVATPTALPADSRATTALALLDVDGDRDLDLVAARFGTSNTLLLNDGTGQFTAPVGGWPADATFSRAVLAADLDGDGDGDLVFGNFGPATLYLGDGSGGFAIAGSSVWPGGLTSTRGLVATDVDSDGRLDLVLARDPDPDVLLLGSATGTFAPAGPGQLPVGAARSSAVASGDVDGDGDPDLFFGGVDGDRLFVNGGNGTFVDASASGLPQPTSTGEAVAARFLDADVDGDLDLWIGRDGPDELFVNDGSGRFARAVSGSRANDSTAAIAIADVDRDGDPDVLRGIARRGVECLTNGHHQIATPYIARVARSWAIEVVARPGYATTPIQAAVWISPAILPAPLSIPPFGDLWLNPVTMFALPPLTLPANGGAARVELPIPNDPALVGARLYSQAGVIHSASVGDWRLTGALQATVVAH